MMSAPLGAGREINLSTDPPPTEQRLDVWLDVSCLCKTRSQAQAACKAGKVDVAGQRAKPHRAIRAGDEIVLTRPNGLRQHVVVVALCEHSVPKAQARMLYEDRTPEPTAEQREVAELVRLTRTQRRPKGAGAPKKKERRELRRIKGVD
jgi:ribosome-associated heat shock protein Hsp15